MYATSRVFRDRASRKGRAGRRAAQVQVVFREMLATRPYGQISAADIADRCGISRSTVYRRWAGTEDMLWSIILPIAERALRSTCAGDFAAAGSAFAELKQIPGLESALDHPSGARHVRGALAQLAASEIERRAPSRRADTLGLLIANLVLAHLGDRLHQSGPADAAFEELVLVIYVASFMTPDAIRSAARDQARQLHSGMFPPAVSVRESLASDEYIISMIDGKPYRSLARHIARFGMTPDKYRQCFSLPDDYPMVAPAYSRRRSELARRSFQSAPVARNLAPVL